MMNQGFGRPGVSPRAVLGALIIKHKNKLDDRGTILSIQEIAYPTDSNLLNTSRKNAEKMIDKLYELKETISRVNLDKEREVIILIRYEQN